MRGCACSTAACTALFRLLACIPSVLLSLALQHPLVLFADALGTACGVAAVYHIATRPLAAAVASMSYETAQKVRQQQVRDRLAYALIIFLGFVALYINIKRTVKEAAEWEKEHN